MAQKARTNGTPRRCSMMFLALLLTALTGACTPNLVDPNAGVPGTGELAGRRVCEVHGDPLQRDLVEFWWGPIRYTQQYLEATEQRFPHANSSIAGGCFPRESDTAWIHFCQSCREAEEAWLRHNPRTIYELPQADDAWNAAFTRSAGWNGGDVAHSIDLRDGRTLWLFGDSLIGPVRAGARVGDESKFVRSAIAWHTTPPAAGAPPTDLTFATGEPAPDVHHAEWITPAPGLWPDDAWYWLMGDGLRIDPGGPGDRLILFATVFAPAGHPEGMWNFRQIGGVIFEITNPAAPPHAWRASQRPNPLVGEAPRHGESSRRTDNWGLAIVPWGDSAIEARGAAPIDQPGHADGEMLYIYGTRSGAFGANGLLLARCAAPDLGDPAAWSFYTGDAWSPDPAAAAAVAAGVPSEFTIQPIAPPDTAAAEEAGALPAPPPLVLIHSEPMLGRRILARTAARPEGPWSEPAAVYEVAEPAADDRLITYAARGHAHLASPGELLLSYVVNSSDFGQIFQDASLYRPRFVRVPVKAIVPQTAP